MPKPPPPPKKDARRHQRFELFASVELHKGQETLILPARNISLGGVYLARDGNNLKSFAPGEHVEVMLFDATDESRPPVRASAQVIRHDPNGMALTWSTVDPKVAKKLVNLLETLKPV
jgi:hypothetical protein